MLTLPSKWTTVIDRQAVPRPTPIFRWLCILMASGWKAKSPLMTSRTRRNAEWKTAILFLQNSWNWSKSTWRMKTWIHWNGRLENLYPYPKNTIGKQKTSIHLNYRTGLYSGIDPWQRWGALYDSRIELGHLWRVSLGLHPLLLIMWPPAWRRQIGNWLGG